MTYFENVMLFYFIDFYSLFWIWNKYIIQKISNWLVDLPIIIGLTQINFFVDKLRSIRLKRRLSWNDFTNQNTKTPNINLIWISDSSYNFRSNVSRRPTNCVSFLSKVLEMPGKSIIYKPYMSPFLHWQNNVFGL
jgi:hypothetical protein